MDAAKILLVDDHALFRQGVRAIIEHEGDLQVVGEAPSCQEALLLARELHLDLILIDICLPDRSGREAISTLKRELPDVKIVVLTVRDGDRDRRRAIRDGAEGFLSKGVRAKFLVESLRSVLSGSGYIPAASDQGARGQTASDRTHSR